MPDMPTLEADFAHFPRQPATVLEGALLISRMVDLGTNVTWCREEIRRLAARVNVQVNAGAVIDVPREADFAGAVDYYEARAAT